MFILFITDPAIRKRSHGIARTLTIRYKTKNQKGVCMYPLPIPIPFNQNIQKPHTRIRSLEGKIHHRQNALIRKIPFPFPSNPHIAPISYIYRHLTSFPPPRPRPQEPQRHPPSTYARAPYPRNYNTDQNRPRKTDAS